MAASLSLVQPDPSIRPAVEAIAVRLADEGIPVRAIARATRLSSDEVYEVLHAAIERATILFLPKDDWPVTNQRIDRSPMFGTGLEDEEKLRTACARQFKTTRLESAMLALLLKRREATKQQLHMVIEENRPDGRDATDPKMVDVIICKLRKKVKSWGIEIQTLWSIGYLLEPAYREKVIALLQGTVSAPPAPAPVISDIRVAHG